MCVIKTDTNKLEKFVSDLNSYALSFKNHADMFNDLILKSDYCWLGSKADEYRNLANSLNKDEFEKFYLSLSSLVEKLSNLQTGLESVINSNKGD